MVSYFENRKQEIGSWLKRFLAGKAAELERVNPLGPDLCGRLERFAVQGKMLRGGLVSLACALCGGEPPPAQPAVETGAAMELFQSALLIHDDIMDRDTTRRGAKTLFYQYAERAEREGARDARHLGESLGICAGDVATFLAFEILAGLQVAAEAQREIQRLAAQELSRVGVAQMQDVSWGNLAVPVRDEEILRLYLYKTGRYTFSLPLMAGALLAEADVELIGQLERLGEVLGILFQIRDDELGLFGEERELGKPVGSDIREGKKTLFYAHLLRLAPAEELERLQGIFGRPEIRSGEIGYVRELAERLGVRAAVQRQVAEHASIGRRLIEALPEVQSEERSVLMELLRYTLARTR